MKDFKEILAEKIAEAANLPKENILDNIEVPKDTSNGDFAFPCFVLAKEMKKSPVIIANELQEKIQVRIVEDKNTIIANVTAINGFLNFDLKKKALAQEVINEFDEKRENFGAKVQKNPKNHKFLQTFVKKIILTLDKIPVSNKDSIKIRNSLE